MDLLCEAALLVLACFLAWLSFGITKERHSFEYAYVFHVFPNTESAHLNGEIDMATF